MVLKNLAATEERLDPAVLAIVEPLGEIEKFTEFCAADIAAAILELEKIGSADSRRHLQKLVYTNLVDRFDYLLDKLLLWSAVKNKKVRKKIFDKMPDETITKKQMLAYLYMKDGLYQKIEEEIREGARLTVLRERHYNKIQTLAESVSWEKSDTSRPRVHKNGQIFATKIANKTSPNSITGYADWLYVRRNCLIHGEGSKYDGKERGRLSAAYAVKLPANFLLSIGSIRSASTFYQSFVQEYLRHLKSSIRDNENEREA